MSILSLSGDTMQQVKLAIMDAIRHIVQDRLTPTEMEMIATAAIKIVEEKNKAVAVVVLSQASEALATAQPPNPAKVVEQVKEQIKSK
jgi:hypothetical protein